MRYLGRGDLQPAGRRPLVGEGGAGKPLALAVHATHGDCCLRERKPAKAESRPHKRREECGAEKRSEETAKRLRNCRRKQDEKTRDGASERAAAKTTERRAQGSRAVEMQAMERSRRAFRNREGH